MQFLILKGFFFLLLSPHPSRVHIFVFPVFEMQHLICAQNHKSSALARGAALEAWHRYWDCFGLAWQVLLAESMVGARLGTCCAIQAPVLGSGALT